MRLALGLSLAALALGAGPASATTSAEEVAVRAAVDGLIASWREGDPALAEAVLLPDFSYVTMRACPGGEAITRASRANMVDAARHPRSADWGDRLKSSTVQIHPSGNAVLLADYEFSIGGEPSHHGGVVIQLFRTASGWKIANFADTHVWLDPAHTAEDCAAMAAKK